MANSIGTEYTPKPYSKEIVLPSRIIDRSSSEVSMIVEKQESSPRDFRSSYARKTMMRSSKIIDNFKRSHISTDSLPPAEEKRAASVTDSKSIELTASSPDMTKLKTSSIMMKKSPLAGLNKDEKDIDISKASTLSSLNHTTEEGVQLTVDVGPNEAPQSDLLMSTVRQWMIEKSNSAEEIVQLSLTRTNEDALNLAVASHLNK